MWPGFKSRRRRHMWVEFVVGSLPCSERFFFGYSGFPLSSKTNIFKFQFDKVSGRRRTTLRIRYLQILFIYFFISTHTCLLSVLTFRSILTFPWVELGGKFNITCAKTGYNASITFHTKPFYGGKLHRVTGEVKNTSTGRVICKVNGEWNGKIEISFTSHQVCVYLKASFFKLKPYR